ncbi:MAG: pilin [Candidatus Magasanikbacteria bacterium]
MKKLKFYLFLFIVFGGLSFFSFASAVGDSNNCLQIKKDGNESFKTVDTNTSCSIPCKMKPEDYKGCVFISDISKKDNTGECTAVLHTQTKSSGQSSLQSCAMWCLETSKEAIKTDKKQEQSRCSFEPGAGGCCVYNFDKKIAGQYVGKEELCGQLCDGTKTTNCVFKQDIEEKDCKSGTTFTVVEKDLVGDPDPFTGLNKLSELNQLKSNNIPNLIGNLIKTAMGLMGSIGLVMFVYGGLLWMTAAGNSEHQKKAMNVLLWSSMGIIVILASYVIVSFVFKAFGL